MAEAIIIGGERPIKPIPIPEPLPDPDPIPDPDADPPYDKCYGCGYLRAEEGQIPVVKYHNGEEEEPCEPYVDGYKPCEDPCHSV